MKTPLTRQRIRQHLTYSAWKYLLLIALTIFGWNIIYTVTAYRPPQEKIVDLYIYGYGEDEALSAWVDRVHEAELPEMEQMEAVFLTTDETYGVMALTARVAAAEGDIYIVPREVFQSATGEEGWFMALDEYTELQDICAERGVSLERCWRRGPESTERHLYGLPVSAVPGLAKYMYVTEDYYIGVLINNGNTENVLRFLTIMLRDLGPEAEAV